MFEVGWNASTVHISLCLVCFETLECVRVEELGGCVFGGCDEHGAIFAGLHVVNLSVVVFCRRDDLIRLKCNIHMKKVMRIIDIINMTKYNIVDKIQNNERGFTLRSQSGSFPLSCPVTMVSSREPHRMEVTLASWTVVLVPEPPSWAGSRTSAKKISQGLLMAWSVEYTTMFPL